MTGETPIIATRPSAGKNRRIAGVRGLAPRVRLTIAVPIRKLVKAAMELKRISPEEARDLLESGEGYVYLDVRSIPEFEAGHAPGAKNVPLLHRTPMGMQPNSEFVAVCERALGKDAKIITACLKGGRSMRAAHVLMENGFSNVVDMRGGFQGESDMTGALVYPGWLPRGLPVTTEASEDETYEGLAGERD